jgi:hypothetical protein
VSVDLDEVLEDIRLNDCELQVGGVPARIPPWAEWLIWLGQWMRVQGALPGRRIAVVRMPSRRLGAAFVAMGSVFGSARLHDGMRDWESLLNLAKGTKVSWREALSGKSVRRSGVFAGVRQIEGASFMEIIEDSQIRRSARSTRLFTKSAALSYGITLGSISAAANERLANAERVLNASIKRITPGWTRSIGIECSVITERTSFLGDLEDLSIRIGGKVEVSCSDFLAIAESGGHSHGKTRVVPIRSVEALDESGFITILDGAAAALRLSETNAQSVVIVLDHAEYDDEIEQLFQTFLGYAVDSHIYSPMSGFQTLPDSVEAFVFGLPSLSEANA